MDMKNSISPKVILKGKYLCGILILSISCILSFSLRLFSVITFESIIHEFDPWFNYRSTLTLVNEGFYEFINWFDQKAWYPLGRIVGGTIYPGLMLTSGIIWLFLNLISMPVHIQHICVFMGPIFSCFTNIITFLLTKEMWNENAGLIAASLIAIAPGYISRSASGSYDNESVAIFAMLNTFYLWIKALKTGKVFWSVLSSISYFYMVSAWGGYVFIINIISLHAIGLVIFQRFSHRLYVAFSVFYLFGLLFSMQIPFVGFQSIKTNEHMSAACAFIILQGYYFYSRIQNSLNKVLSWESFYLSIVFIGTILAILVGLTKSGIIAPWSGRFYSLWDLTYAAVNIPIITSVAEHQPATWTATFYDLTILLCFYPAGIWNCFRELQDEHFLLIFYSIFVSYFSGIMVRIVLILTPIVCICSGISISNLLNSDVTIYETEIEQSSNQYDKLYHKTSNLLTVDGFGDTCRRLYNNSNKLKKAIKINVTNVFTGCFIIYLMVFYSNHCLDAGRYAYSSPSVVMATSNSRGERVMIDDFREAYYWLRYNTHPDARIMSWWDYGYQITGMANRTTIVDNNTWNNSHIALVGKAMSLNESEAWKIAKKLDVDYVLVIFGGLFGYTGDDINKFLWMVRISEGEHPKDVYEFNYYTQNGEYVVDRRATKTMLNSLMYRLSYLNFGSIRNTPNGPPGYDMARHQEIGLKNFQLKHFQEAFTSASWIVRIYSLKPLKNRVSLNYARKKHKRFTTHKSFRSLKGYIKYGNKIKRGIKKYTIYSNK